MTNYVRNRGFLTCLSWFLRICDRELHSLKNWELKFSDFFDKRAVTGNIHMKTSQEQKIRREQFIWAVLVLDKTCSYKWYWCVLCKTQLSFLRINGPNVYIYIVSHQVVTHSFNIKASFWKIYFILKLLYTSSKSKLIYSHLPLADFS